MSKKNPKYLKWVGKPAPVYSTYLKTKEGRKRYDADRKSWRRANEPDFRERDMAQSLQYRADHKDEIDAYGAAYRAEHKEEKAAYDAANYEKNSELADDIYGPICKICGSPINRAFIHPKGNSDKTNDVTSLFKSLTPDAWMKEATHTVRACQDCNMKYDLSWSPSKPGPQCWNSLEAFTEKVKWQQAKEQSFPKDKVFNPLFYK